jgi:hypothetical protein
LALLFKPGELDRRLLSQRVVVNDLRATLLFAVLPLPAAAVAAAFACSLGVGRRPLSFARK